MKQQSKLNAEQQQQQAAEHQTQAQPAREFSSPEEMLRYDAAQTVVPPVIAERLQQSIGPLPPPARPWWRRLLGGPNP